MSDGRRGSVGRVMKQKRDEARQPIPGEYEPTGTWFYVVDVTPPGVRPRKQTRRAGFPTKRTAQAALNAALDSLAKRTYVASSRQTLREYVEADWLPAIGPTLRQSTQDSYRRNLRLHVTGRTIGATPLQAVDAGALNKLYGDLLGIGLSARTVAYVATILHRAFRDAVRWGRLVVNPADAADPPRPKTAERRQMRTWTAEQVRAFLGVTKDGEHGAAWHVFASTGLRRGEVLGLAWADVDLDAATLSVRRTVVEVEAEPGREQTWAWSDPKTAKGRRLVALDPDTIAVLRAHRTAQLQRRMLVGEGYRTDLDLVFCRPDGDVIHPKAISDGFRVDVKRSGLPYLSLHGLRHTWATLALQAGIHPRVVQERLGHSSVGVTLDIYSHVTPSLQAEAASRVAALFGADAASP